jgi:hypothetical protein
MPIVKPEDVGYTVDEETGATVFDIGGSSIEVKAMTEKELNALGVDADLPDSVQMYLKSIGKTALLSGDQEKELAKIKLEALSEKQSRIFEIEKQNLSMEKDVVK